MKKIGMARGLPQLVDHSSNCVACQFGRLKRKPFLKSAWRASQKLQLIHTDVGGPQKNTIFESLVENQSSCKIQILRSDNGKEYTSAKFNLFCKEVGIDNSQPLILHNRMV